MSKICNIPVKTLRYYDEIGLLVPHKRDEATGYRYYAKNQIMQVNIINQFKVHGFSLKELKEHITNNNVTLSTQQLNKKKKEIHKTIEDLIKLEKNLEFHLESLQYNDHLPHLQLKEIPSMNVAYIRQQGLANKVAFMHRLSQLRTLIINNHLSPINHVMARYFDDYRQYDLNKADIEVFIEVEDKVIDNIVETRGAFFAVSAIHYGPYENEYITYTLMMDYIKKEKLIICGPAIENYLIDPLYTDHEQEYVTELLIPVKRT